MSSAIPFLLSLILLQTACTAAKTMPSSQKHIRRVQTNEDEDEWYLPDAVEQEDEWYLPDLKVQIKKTWLFGAGDSAEWGGNDASNNNNNDSTTEDDTSKIRMPTPIEISTLLSGEYVTSVSAGGLHSVVLTNEGRILTAGSSPAGEEGWGLGRDTKNGAELGFMPVTEGYATVDTTTTTTSLPQFVKVAASQYYTLALDNLGNVWSTGNNAYGQLCLNDTVTRDRFHQVSIPIDDNNLFDDQGGGKIIDIVLGERHTFLLREDGKLWGCGWNQYGQLGIGLRGGNVLAPVEIMIDAPDDETTDGTDGDDASNAKISQRQINHEVVTNVVAGRGSSYFLTSSGHVYATGTNYKGQLCLGHREDVTLPSMLAGVETFLSSGGVFSMDDAGVGVESIAAGASSLYILLSNGLVLTCGENTHGQLGIGSSEADSIDVPTTIANVTNTTAVFSGPTSFGAYFVSDRAIYAVGFDGVGARENWSVPNMMACANEETTLKKGVVISSGNDHTLYLATVETTFECEGGASATASPSMNPSPDIPPMPSLSPSESSQLFQTSMPTMLPTGSPTISLSPSSSSSPTSSPTTTLSPSFSSLPTTATGAPTTFTPMPT
ncbi:hypothetical protein ACHAXR_008522, partial [Thalassiosira sp. AJA248-18]